MERPPLPARPRRCPPGEGSCSSARRAGGKGPRAVFRAGGTHSPKGGGFPPGRAGARSAGHHERLLQGAGRHCSSGSTTGQEGGKAHPARGAEGSCHRDARAAAWPSAAIRSASPRLCSTSGSPGASVSRVSVSRGSVCLYAVSDQGFRPFFIWDLALRFQKLSQGWYQAAELKTKCSLAPESCFLCSLGRPEAAQTGGSCLPLGSLTSLTPQMSDTGHLLCYQTGVIKYTSNEEPSHHCSLPWGSGDVCPSSSGHG